MANLFETSSARVSECGTWRFELRRVWDRQKPLHCWVMLNPSTADDAVDDPTIRRVASYAWTWGAGGIIVVNLFAFRATAPAELLKADDPVGPGNDDAIRAAVAEAQLVVAAWGANKAIRLNGRRAAVRALLPRDTRCIGFTAGGEPRHPLYGRKDAELERLDSGA